MRQIFLRLLILFLTAVQLHAQNQNISNGNVFEGEPFIAVNPSNPQNVVVAWMGFVAANAGRLSIKVRSSFDGGVTWKPIVTMPHVVATYKSADPSMAFDKNGVLFLSFIDYQESPAAGGVYVYKSINGGLNWGSPIMALDILADGDKSPIDRPWLAINENGDKLYISTKPAPWIPAPNRPYLVHSVDGGQTWSPWRYIDGPGNLVGNFIQAPMAAPAAMSDRFYAAYPSYVGTQNVFPQFILATSADAGGTIQYKGILASSTTASNDSAKLAYKLLVDPSNANHLVFVYPFQPFGDIDVMLTETYNAGSTWTTPTRVNDDPPGNGKMQDLIWGDFDQDGALVISWRDRRNAPGTGYANSSEFYAAYRPKNAQNFNPNFKLSDLAVAYNNILAQNGNDFMGIELSKDTIRAVWANTRDGSLDVWFVRLAAPTGQVSSLSLLGSESPDVSIFPNPSDGLYQVELQGDAVIDAITVYNAAGKLVYTNHPNSLQTMVDLRSQPSGIYTIQVAHNGTISVQKLLK